MFRRSDLGDGASARAAGEPMTDMTARRQIAVDNRRVMNSPSMRWRGRVSTVFGEGEGKEKACDKGCYKCLSGPFAKGSRPLAWLRRSGNHLSQRDTELYS